MSHPLNREQAQAARALTGQVLINAGAGSGKTRTLTERLVLAMLPDAVEGWLPADVDEVAAITFTEKAAGELSERIRGSLRAAGLGEQAARVDGAWISTIHAFCGRILRRHAIEAGLDPGFAVVDGTRAGMLREDAFEEAARALMVERPHTRLLELYSIDALYHAAERLRTVAISERLGLERAIPERHTPKAALLDSARAFFGQAHEALGTCELGSSSSMAAHAEQCEAVLSALLEADADAPAEEVGNELRAILERYRQKRSVKAHAELCADIVETRSEMISQAVALETAQYATDLLALTRDYAHAYDAAKLQRGLLDFDDLQSRTMALLEQHPDIAARYRSQFRLMMVDEFQDTDRLQLAVVRAVSSDNLCTVGDERQSIYRFRGADIYAYRAHNATMLGEGAREFVLGENYRSHPDVLAFVNHVFSDARLFGQGNLIALRAGRTEPPESALESGAPRVELAVVDKVSRGDAPAREAEARHLAGRLADLGESVDFGEMVILLRSYRHAATYARALQERGVPSLIVGGSRFYALKEVSLLRAVLSVVANTHDDAAYATILDSHLVGVSPDGIWRLARTARSGAEPLSLWAATEAAADLNADDVRRIRTLRGAIERCRSNVGDVPLGVAVMHLVEDLGFDRALLETGSDGKQAYANVMKLARMATAYDKAEVDGLPGFLAYLDASERLGEHEAPAVLADDGASAVRIMSIHASKGLEFPVVAVPELAKALGRDDSLIRTRISDGVMEVALAPPSRDGEGSSSKSPLYEQIAEARRADEVDELKRVLYVACTRARELLLLSGAASLAKGTSQDNPISWIRGALDLDAVVEPGEQVVQFGEETRLLVSVIPEIDTESGRPLCAGDSTSEPAAPATMHEAPSAAPPASASLAGPDVGRADRAPESDRFAPAHITYSDIGEYERCALRYRATRLWRVGNVGRGEEATSPLQFGVALHAVLQLEMTGMARPGERDHAIATYFGLDAAGISRLTHARSAFTSSGIAQRVRACERLAAESSFSLELRDGAARPFRLRGSIDLLGITGTRAIVVDYKTGTSGEPPELAARYEAQARCYALAVLSGDVTDVELHFVRPEVRSKEGEMQVVSFSFGASDLVALREYVTEKYRALAEEPYEPLEAWDEPTCRQCPIAGTVCKLRVPRL